MRHKTRVTVKQRCFKYEKVFVSSLGAAAGTLALRDAGSQGRWLSGTLGLRDAGSQGRWVSGTLVLGDAGSRWCWFSVCLLSRPPWKLTKENATLRLISLFSSRSNRRSIKSQFQFILQANARVQIQSVQLLREKRDKSQSLGCEAAAASQGLLLYPLAGGWSS